MSTFKTSLDLNSIAMNYGTDKGTYIRNGENDGHMYTYIYQKHLEPIRDKPLRILEIGVHKGASLRMWEEYLPNAKIYALDINPECATHASDRSKVFIADATDVEGLRKNIFSEIGDSFDIIIDDGSHRNDHIIMSLEGLFPHLSFGGLYFIEDIFVTAINGEWRVPYRGYNTFFDYISQINLQMNICGKHDKAVYKHADLRTRRLFESAVEMDITMWNQHLFAIHLYTNMCVLEKQERMRKIS